MVSLAIDPNVPTVSYGKPTSFKIAPVLPAGLSLYTTSGAISGTPNTASHATEADGQYHVYQLDFSKSLEGSFNGLRLDTGNGAGDTLHVDYWRIGTFIPVMTMTAVAGNNLRISWPSAAAGYSVQSAASVLGPWTREITPVKTQGNENYLEIQPADAQKYLRLAK